MSTGYATRQPSSRVAHIVWHDCVSDLFVPIKPYKLDITQHIDSTKSNANSLIRMSRETQHAARRFFCVPPCKHARHANSIEVITFTLARVCMARGSRARSGGGGRHRREHICHFVQLVVVVVFTSVVCAGTLARRATPAHKLRDLSCMTNTRRLLLNDATLLCSRNAAAAAAECVVQLAHEVRMIRSASNIGEQHRRTISTGASFVTFATRRRLRGAGGRYVLHKNRASRQ